MFFRINNVVTKKIATTEFVAPFLIRLGETGPAKSGNSQVVDLYSKVLSAMALDSETDLVKAVGIESRLPAWELSWHRRKDSSAKVGEELLRSSDLLTIVKQCRMLQISSMPLYSGLKESVTKDSKYLRALLSQLIFPFLKGLLVESSGCSWNEDTPVTFFEDCMQFVRDMLRSIMQVYVKEKPEAANYTYPTITTCDCEDCRGINKFLKDPKMKSTTFQNKEKQRKHICSQIAKIDGLETETLREGRPFKLVVRKKGEALIDWKIRAKHADEWISSLGTRTELVNALGGAFVQELVSQDIISKETNAEEPEQTTTEGRSQKRAGNGRNKSRKRAKVVDLT